MKSPLFDDGPTGSSQGCRIRPLSAEDRLTHRQSRACGAPTAILIPQHKSELLAAGAGVANAHTAFAETQAAKFQAPFQSLGGGTHRGRGVVFQTRTRETGAWLSRGEDGDEPLEGLACLCAVSGVTAFEIPQEAGKERFELAPAGWISELETRSSWNPTCKQTLSTAGSGTKI